MTYLSRATAAAGAVLAAAGLLGAGPAHAAARDPFPGTWLYLTVTKGDSEAGGTYGSLLRCDPPRGHVHAAEACAELAAADGDIGRIPAENVICPMIFAPVTAHARGQWHGRQIDFRQTYANACILRARTGAVFALDE
ncbi:SSI family serine proteinase inhibitor [Streptomyces sp. NPDC020192]|uniref:SSI family serine proteinase inhibitor n=1 Tax=Streptomyces sp. NPDC020192 TaxID=3365066 RepID=UPI0037B7A3B3